ncbi:cupin domain [Roseiarcus fermentans]|uniref:Cupin domain n=1 Tax=Roseiarcus fermentans TaxID=1473586 RepID=A0A366FDJ4_9HYPH|nr:cupin domain-containing protein [Roseiarcus fermentans]RBP12010.1 cupin domain [Roseiarcus fermentans]
MSEFRRIVTTDDENGKSGVLIDGVASNRITVLTEMWVTGDEPVDPRDGIDHAERSDRLEPPAGGTLFRYFEIAPESETAHLSDAEKRKANAEWFAAMNGAHLQPDTSRHPGMHRSKTTDYIILLSGEITLLLDKEERTLKPFDCVIQRGTNHAWVNRGSETALLVAVLVDADTASRG